MTQQPRVLLVSLSAGIVEPLAAHLPGAGYIPTVATDFHSARVFLDRRPAMLVTDVKLGPYNGLHLAIRAGHVGIPVIVIGPIDPGLQAEAKRLEAIYVTSPVVVDDVVTLIGDLVNAGVRSRGHKHDLHSADL